ncbi:MAG: endonuclease/exonuclease/phosphatase family protein [Chloroflexi bacterium]|nr:endonuclease/exonuclease/phosphatase family protein [Chloroflexota bacterium]
MIKVVSWNVGKMYQPLEELLAMNDTDVALLQEVGAGMRDHLSAAGGPIATSPHDPWEPAPKSDYDRWPLVVKLSDRVEIEWFRQVRATIPREDNDEIAVSCGGTIAAAKVNPLEGGEPFIAVSMYARWFTPHPTTGSRYIYSDAAAHHIISDGNVATFYTSGNSPATAENQLDYVFASRGFHNSVRTRAVNGVDEWGSSDHCRILIEVGDRTAS